MIRYPSCQLDSSYAFEYLVIKLLRFANEKVKPYSIYQACQQAIFDDLITITGQYLLSKLDVKELSSSTLT